MTAQNVLNAMHTRARRSLMILAAVLLFASPLFLLPVAVHADPSVPLDVQAAPGDQEVQITWTEPTETDEGIESYEVDVRPEGGGSGDWELAATVDGSTFETVIDEWDSEPLENGVSYAFRVRAISNEGEGPYAGAFPDLITATPFGSPSIPQEFETNPGNGQVTLIWEAPANNNGRTVESYLVEYQQSGSPGWTTFETVIAPTTTSTVTSLTNGTAYDFRVSAYNGTWYDGTDSYGPYAQANNVVPFTVPNAPESFTATPGNQQVGLVWQEPSFNGGRTITGYVVEYKLSSDPDDPSNWEEETTSNTEITISGLTNGEQYDFRVSAENQAGTGAYAETSATPSSVPSVPQDLTATPGDKQVKLVWEHPADDGGFPITEYIVEYKLTADADDPSNWTDIDHDSDDTEATITGLTNGTAYDFRVTAVTSAGNGSPASVVNVTPFTDVPNDGDANGDGIQDSLQPYVSGMVNPVTGAYAVLEADPACTVDALDINAPSTDDPGFAYPAGLMNFTLDCGTLGFTTTVKQYYYGSYDPALIVARKLRADNSYMTIVGATAENVTIGGQQVLTLAFQITDGSELDNDGDANGTIVDPSGPALNTAGVPNTGLGGSQSKQSGWRNLFGLPVLFKR